MQLIAALEFGGAERLAATICSSLPKNRFKTSVCGFIGKEGALVEDLRREGIPYFYLDAACGSKIDMFRKLYQLLRVQQVDILQIHGAYTLMNCFLPAKLAGVKIVYTEHAKQTILKLRLANLAAKFFPYGTAKVVCVSKNLQAFFSQVLGVSGARLQVIHNGIDIERFRTDRLPFSDDGKERAIGCIARLTEAKDHNNLLEAFSRVAKLRAGIKLVLVGEGEMRRCIEQKIFELGLCDSVELLGNRNDVAELLGGMDIFVLPSKREGFPVSILEAMAAGRPVIATDVGGVAEVITTGENGIIVPPENSEKLAEALFLLIDNPDRTKTMAVKGHSDVAANFNKQKMIKSYECLYLSILDMM